VSCIGDFDIEIQFIDRLVHGGENQYRLYKLELSFAHFREKSHGISHFLEYYFDFDCIVVLLSHFLEYHSDFDKPPNRQETKLIPEKRLNCIAISIVMYHTQQKHVWLFQLFTAVWVLYHLIWSEFLSLFT
jgi:hypothetical protein